MTATEISPSRQADEAEQPKDGSFRPTSRTTRVCIKNVPLNFDNQHLRQHLIQNCHHGGGSPLHLVLTDCKILHTKAGKSRRMAFVGTKTADMAEQLIRKLHKTYAGTSRLLLEPAFSKQQRDSDDAMPHRPWSKHSVGSSRYERLHRTNGAITKNDDDMKKGQHDSWAPQKQPLSANDKVERHKQEFLAAMGASADGGNIGKAKFWSNDDGIVSQRETGSTEDPQGQPSADDGVRSAASSNSGDMEDDVNSVSSDDSGGEGADVMQSLEANRSHGSVMSDMDFLRSKVTTVDDLSEAEVDQPSQLATPTGRRNTANMGGDERAESDSENESLDSSDSDLSCSSSDDEEKATNNSGQHAATESSGLTMDRTEPSAAVDSQLCPNRLFVRNLPFTSMEEELLNHFSAFGSVASCHVPVDDQKRNKGYAFVEFETHASAQQALNNLDGTDFQGRLLHVLPARRGPSEGIEDTMDETNLTYKQKQELARQKQASKSSQGWSASFVRGDAVVDNLADRLGLNKDEILNVKDGLSSGDAAVRLALGETHIIEENRDYFRGEGVDMEALVSAKGNEDDTTVKRSNTNILVKNLPYDTELEELTKMFHGVGGDPPTRILLPPSRTIAMVEYGHSTDARRAFRKLAYKRFKHVPLYLEWAPFTAKVEAKMGVQNTISSAASSSSPVQQAATTTPSQQGTSTQPPDDEEDVDTGVSCTIYVKNLNFSTTPEQLRNAFSKHVPTIRAVNIPTKTAPIQKAPSVRSDSTEWEHRSMGFGFVECASEESVRKAIKALQGIILDGHALELKRSNKGITSSSAKTLRHGKTSTKVMVRNVAFQATRKELLQLFGSFGQLKKVRLPKKFDGNHRGFAFVEYLTHQDAQSAMTALSRTHLYGRHLVLEWASDKEDVDTLREKAKRDVSVLPAGGVPKNKRIRFDSITRGL